MVWFSLGVAVVASLGIIAVGSIYILSPRSAVGSFGLPPPEEGPNVTWWLRLKGVRDIVAGLVVLLMMAFAGHREVGLVLLIESLIALGDMSVILVAKGSTRTAFSVHGVTAVVMILAAIPLVAGWV